MTNGGKQAVYESFQVLLNDGDEVIIPTPFWTSYPEAVKLAGGKPVEVFAGADRGFEPDIAAIEAARTERTKAIIITSPNNPTGAVWSRETIRAIGEWAVEHHVWVISDEIYEHLNYDGAKTAYVASRSPECRDQLLVLNGVAKPTRCPAGELAGWSPRARRQGRRQAAGPFELQRFQRSAASGARRVAGSLDEVHMMRESFDAAARHCRRPERYPRRPLPDAHRCVLCVPRCDRPAGQAARRERHRREHVFRTRRGAAGRGPCRRGSGRGVRRSRIPAFLVCAGR